MEYWTSRKPPQAENVHVRTNRPSTTTQDHALNKQASDDLVRPSLDDWMWIFQPPRMTAAAHERLDVGRQWQWSGLVS